MKYVIFGAGQRGTRFYESYADKYDIVCFCDNNPQKQGTEYMGLLVISPEELVSENFGVIIASKDNHFEIAQQLFNIGIKEFFLPFLSYDRELGHFDLREYNDLKINPRRICLIEHRASGSNARALKMFNPFEDIDLSIIRDVYDDGRSYFSFWTSSLVISQFANDAKGKKCIELWHGFPIKALNNACFDQKAIEDTNRMTNLFNRERVAICSYSRLYNIFFGYAMRIYQKQFRITGMPRNDMLFSPNGHERIVKLLGNVEDQRVVIYVPTFRKSEWYNVEGMNEGMIFDWKDFSFEDFDKFLLDNNILFIMKIHSGELSDVSIRNTKSIKLLSDDSLFDLDIDLYEILNETDMMLTDYSSIAVDYLLINKPIVFAIKDEEEYSEKHGLMTEPFEDWAPGECVKTYHDLKASILNALDGEDIYCESRKRMCRIMHQYADAGSTRRVLDLAKTALDLQ